MEITEVRIKLMADPNDRLQAFCSVTFDSAFVIRDLKIIQGTKGSFVAMPSRKLTDRCAKCRGKNDLRASYCNQCGVRLNADRAPKDMAGRARLYADIAHPINSECREMIQTRVVEAFAEERILATRPNYVCRYDDFGEDTIAVPTEQIVETIPFNQPALESESEPVPQTIVFPGSEDRSHRIDPAAPTTATNQPHPSEAPAKTSDRATAQVDEDDPFGVGL
jgi:stage V sporulation protein G